MTRGSHKDTTARRNTKKKTVYRLPMTEMVANERDTPNPSMRGEGLDAKVLRFTQGAQEEEEE